MNNQANEPTKIMLTARASLLPLVKSTITTYQAKFFPFARALFGFCLAGLFLVSCASASRSNALASVSKRAGNVWWGNYTQISRENCKIDGQDLEKYWFNDYQNNTYGYQIPQGQHNIEISARWSNGFEDSAQLTLDVKEGRKYTFHTYELKEGQDPNAPVDLTKDYSEGRTYRGTSGGKWKKDAMEYFIVACGAFPPLCVLGIAGAIVSTGVLEMQRQRQRSPQINEAKTNPDGTANMETQPTDRVGGTAPQPPDSPPDTETKPEETVVTKVSQNVEPPPAPMARPFDGCCYVWIEDSETREVVAGTRLPGAGIDGH